MSLYQRIAEIGLEELTNTILVDTGARNAFLLQYIDNGERAHTDPISAGKLAAIKKYYPDLKFTQNSQGMIISRKSYNSNKNLNSDSSTQIGKVLDYPCAAEFNTLNRSKVLYTYNINVWFKPTIGSSNNVIQLLANLCPSKAKHNEFEELATKFRNALKADPLIGRHVIDVVVEVDEVIPPGEVLRRITNNTEITSQLLHEVSNIFFNSGYSPKFTIDNFQLHNPIHRGMLISILIYHQHDTLQPFYPIQNTPHEAEIVKITSQQEKALLTALKNTRI